MFGDYLPDPIERGEARAERMMEDLEYNPKEGTMKCANCGKRCKVSEMVNSSPDPYSAPICQECCPWDGE